MRYIIPFVFFASPAFSDVLAGSSHIQGVTLYPEGAQITRIVTFDAPVGAHEVRVDGVSLQENDAMIRAVSGQGHAVGAYQLQKAGDVAPDDARLQQEQGDLAAAQQKRDAAALALDRLDAEIKALEIRKLFLQQVKFDASAPNSDLTAVLNRITAEAGDVTQKMAEAGAKRAGLLRDMQKADEALAKAQEKYDERRAFLRGQMMAVFDLDQQKAGQGSFTIQYFTQNAGWRPVYDVYLTQQPQAQISLSRGVMVRQSSGEDWQGVKVTLSTAQLSNRLAPTDVGGDLRSVGKEEEWAEKRRMPASPAAMDEVEEMPAALAVATGMEGDNIVYHVEKPVTLNSGADELRLSLGTQTITPELEARAVPRFDENAYLVANVVNGDEVVLAGDAFFFRDGGLIGVQRLERLAPQGKAQWSFGALEGVRLKQDQQRNLEGDEGFFSSDSARHEKIGYEIENITDQTWPLHVLDQIPYSEQKELAVTLTAQPEPVEQDVDGRRGVVGWRFDLAPQAVQKIDLDVQMRWPTGMQLR